MSRDLRDRLAAALSVVAVLGLGLSAGAMLTEAVVFVDFWRALPPAEFLAWFAANEPGLVAFFGPLQTASAVLVLGAAMLARPETGRGLHVVAVLFALAALGLYPLYFRDVNAGFAAGTIAAERVPEELARWSRWQWLRTAIGTAAFAAAALGATRRGRGH